MEDTTSLDVVILYSPKDDQYRVALYEHIERLIRNKVIKVWDASRVLAGDVTRNEIQEHIQTADIIIILLSSKLLSDECYQECESLVFEQMRARTSRVVPVLISAFDRAGTDFEHMEVLPKTLIPIDASPDKNAAWESVVQDLRELLRGTKTAGRRYSPQYTDDRIRALCEQQRIARDRYNHLQRHKCFEEAAAVKEEINELQRKIREGGQLQAGEYIGDGRFLLVSKIGQGGYAVVWKAIDEHRHREVAIKQLHPSRARDQIALSRFKRGAERMAMLHHRAVAEVLEPCREEGKFHYFVMPFYQGGDLYKAALQRTLSDAKILEIIVIVAEALGEAHRKELVHRDVKPPNILLDLDFNPYLSDFELVYAPDTTGGTNSIPISTYLFSAPEAMSTPQTVDARVDVFSLGMTAIYCLYRDKFPLEEWEARRNRDGLIGPLPCNSAVKRVLRKSISSKPADRYANASRFAEELVRALEHIDTEIEVVTVHEPPRRRETLANALEMCAIPAGQFWMGTTQQDEGTRDDERPMRSVVISSSFFVSRDPVNRKTYEKVVNNKSIKKSAELPVEVTWIEAIRFCNMLSTLEGIEPAYTIYEVINGVGWRLESDGYRLPTEAEWEYAARGTDGRVYPWGNEAPTNQLCWSGERGEFGRIIRNGSCPVGAYPDGASPFGVLDMVGNVTQWCWDWYDRYNHQTEQSSSVDPIGSVSGFKRVTRGAHWSWFTPSFVRAAQRTPLLLNDKAGIRCVRGPLARGGHVETTGW